MNRIHELRRRSATTICMATLLLVGTAGTACDAAGEKSTPRMRFPIGDGFELVLQLSSDQQSGDLIARYEMQYNALGQRVTLVRSERRIQQRDGRVSIPLKKSGLSGLEINGTVSFQRSGNNLVWRVSGRGYNRHAGVRRAVTLNKSGRTRLPGRGMATTPRKTNRSRPTLPIRRPRPPRVRVPKLPKRPNIRFPRPSVPRPPRIRRPF